MIFINTVEGDIAIDATIRETTDLQSTLTQHPVEFGADISDHIFANPKVYRFEGGVSNIAFKEVNNDIARGSFGSELTRAQTAWEVLQAIQLAGVPFDVQTGLELIPNMLIIGLTNERDKETSNVLKFQCSLREVLLAELSEVQLPEALLAPVSKTKASTVGKGQKQGDAITSKSLLLQIGELFFGGAE